MLSNVPRTWHSYHVQVRKNFLSISWLMIQYCSTINDHLGVNLSLFWSWCHFLWLRFLWENTRCLFHCNIMCIIFCNFVLFLWRNTDSWSLLSAYIPYPINSDKNASRMTFLPDVWMPYFSVLRIPSCRHTLVTWLSVENRSNLWKKNTRFKRKLLFLLHLINPFKIYNEFKKQSTERWRNQRKKNSYSFARTSCDYKRMKWKEQWHPQQNRNYTSCSTEIKMRNKERKMDA